MPAYYYTDASRKPQSTTGKDPKPLLMSSYPTTSANGSAAHSIVKQLDSAIVPQQTDPHGLIKIMLWCGWQVKCWQAMVLLTTEQQAHIRKHLQDCSQVHSLSQKSRPCSAAFSHQHRNAEVNMRHLCSAFTMSCTTCNAGRHLTQCTTCLVLGDVDIRMASAVVSATSA